METVTERLMGVDYTTCDLFGLLSDGGKGADFDDLNSSMLHQSAYFRLEKGEKKGVGRLFY